MYRQALVLARHGNYARAADALGIAQPNLTRAIAALERALGVRLFDRGRSGAVPTAFGRVFVERAEALLRSEAELRRELQLLADLATGTLRIACGPYAAEVAVADAVARLVGAHPALRVECTVMAPERVLAEVLAGHADVGVASDSLLEEQPALQVERFAPLRIHLACRPGHPLTRERALSCMRCSTRWRRCGCTAAMRCRSCPASCPRARHAAYFPSWYRRSSSTRWRWRAGSRRAATRCSPASQRSWPTTWAPGGW